MYPLFRHIVLLPVILSGALFPVASETPLYHEKNIPPFSEMTNSGNIASGTVIFPGTNSGSTKTKIEVPAKKTHLPPLQTLRSPFIVIPEVRSDANNIDVFVSKLTALSNTGYVPKDLVSIVHPYIDEAGRHSDLRKEAAESLWKMSVAFYKKFNTPIVVVSGYRSAAYQQRLWNLGRCSDTLCAPAGHSEHQLGLAVDLFDASTKNDYLANAKFASYVAWLSENAHLYGWHQSYQKWEDIDEYEVEPWHWRYLGVDLATKLKNLKWTFTEYTNFNESLKWIN